MENCPMSIVLNSLMTMRKLFVEKFALYNGKGLEETRTY